MTRARMILLKASAMLVALSSATALLTRPAARTGVATMVTAASVSSWYDSGVRLTPTEAKLVLEATPAAAGKRWYDGTDAGPYPGVVAHVGGMVVSTAPSKPEATKIVAPPRPVVGAIVELPQSHWHEGSGAAVWPGVTARVGCIVVAPAARSMAASTAAPPAPAERGAPSKPPVSAPASVSSWYDAGVRLKPVRREAAAASAKSWYEGTKAGPYPRVVAGVGGMVVSTAPSPPVAPPKPVAGAIVQMPQSHWHEGCGEARFPGVTARVGCIAVPAVLAAGSLPIQAPTAKEAAAAAAAGLAPVATVMSTQQMQNAGRVRVP